MESLQKFYCSNNQITRIENLPQSLRTFWCDNNRITRIENLPQGLRAFNYINNPITHVDGVEISRVNFTLRGYQTIKRTQRRTLRRFKSNEVILLEALEDWVWKPLSNDNTFGIRPRLDALYLEL